MTIDLTACERSELQRYRESAVRRKRLRLRLLQLCGYLGMISSVLWRGASGDGRGMAAAFVAALSGMTYGVVIFLLDPRYKKVKS